jgi:crotonobetainyl-CoA:carnitine CoA-transferase CaiB-like acyl-CoA transferase
MDNEETVEATRWLMKSNWGPDQNTSPALATGIILGLRARDRTGKKGQPVHVTKLNANAWTNADEYYDHADRPPIAMPDEEIHGLHALYRLYRCREGWAFLGCLSRTTGRHSTAPWSGETSWLTAASLLQRRAMPMTKP